MKQDTYVVFFWHNIILFESKIWMQDIQGFTCTHCTCTFPRTCDYAKFKCKHNIRCSQLSYSGHFERHNIVPDPLMCAVLLLINFCGFLRVQWNNVYENTVWQSNPSNGKYKPHQQVNSSKTNVLLTAVDSNHRLTQAMNLYDTMNYLFQIAQNVKLIIIIIINHCRLFKRQAYLANVLNHFWQANLKPQK